MVEAPVSYKPYETDDYYTINGSVMNIKTENLGIKYMGRSYIGLEKDDTVTYVFAETSTENARTPVQVAESAIINADPALADETTVNAVKADYIDRFVNAYKAENEDAAPKTDVKVNVYLQTSEGYVLSEEKSGVRPVSYSGYGSKTTFADMPVIEDYVFFTASEDNELTVTFGGTQEINAYYNYTGNRITLFDGEGENFLGENTSNYGTTNVYNYGPQDKGPWNHLYEETNYVYEGGKALHNDFGNGGWDGIVWLEDIDLGFATDTLKMWIAGGGKTGTMDVDTIELYARNASTGSWGWPNNKSSISVTEEGEYQEVQFTFAFDQIRAFIIKDRAMFDDGAHVYLDSISVVRPLSVQTNIPETYEFDTIEFTANATGSEYFADQLASALTVEYRVKDAEEWTTITETDGKYTIPTSGKTYEVKMTVEVGADTYEKIYEVKFERSDPAVFGSFEPDGNGGYYGFVKDLGGTSSYPDKVAPSTEWAHSGKYSLKYLTCTQNGWVYFDMGATLPYSTNKFTVWINNSGANAWTDCQFYINEYSNKVTIEPGVHQYTFTFNSRVSSVGEVYLSVKNNNGNTPVYIDDFRAVDIETFATFEDDGNGGFVGYTGNKVDTLPIVIGSDWAHTGTNSAQIREGVQNGWAVWYIGTQAAPAVTLAQSTTKFGMWIKSDKTFSLTFEINNTYTGTLNIVEGENYVEVEINTAVSSVWQVAFKVNKMDPSYNFYVDDLKAIYD